ncbi:MAG TPA: glutamate 5-kinase [Firmicutes bacterium]|nr:glutamate 5-kinase [Bacillota bacterium]
MNVRERLKDHKRIVVKIGTATVTYPNGRINLRRLEQLAWVLADLKNQGKEVVLVSSGAMGVGSAALGFAHRPTEIRFKQAAASVGQASLIQIYKNFFNEYNQKVAQILLTKEDIKNDTRKATASRTFETLLHLGVLPIVNNNDAVATVEFEFSDNDTLSAVVAALIRADLLVLLTDIDALYDCDPKKNPDAHRLSIVEEVTPEIMAMAGEKGSAFSVGGMETKLAAAKLCKSIGADMVIASGENPKILHRIIEGEDVGTVFIGRDVE